jgi:hypothetical protein
VQVLSIKLLGLLGLVFRIEQIKIYSLKKGVFQGATNQNGQPSYGMNVNLAGWT